jgi:hypothetical protein
MLGLSACASNIQDITDKYTSSSLAVKQFAKITSQDWLFGSGIIQGALQEPMLPKWVFEELQKVDKWFLDGKELNDWELGYLVGLRIRLAAPIIKAAIEQYAPGILSITEVGAVLAFIGL